MNPEIIGLAAAAFTTAAYIPQTLKALRTRETKGISIGMFSLISCGLSLWLVYGFMIESWSIIIANGLTLPMALVIVAMKRRHG